MRSTLALLILSALCFAQNQAQHPTALVNQPFYDASSNLVYLCTAQQIRPNTSSVKRSDSSLTSIVVSSNTATVTTASAHGAWANGGMTITVSGSSTAALNGTYKVLTVPSSTTYTFTTSGVSDGTYNESSLVISTFNPLLTQKVWQIQVLTYDSSNRFGGQYYANATTDFVLACSDRANY